MDAKFFDISSYIDTNYEKNGFVKMRKKEFNEKIKYYLENNKEIKTGDIIFVGSDYETRQEYGFCLVINKDFKSGEYGPNLPLKFKNELPLNIKYGNILEYIKNDDDLYLLWYGDDNTAGDETINEYKNNNLY